MKKKIPNPKTKASLASNNVFDEIFDYNSWNVRTITSNYVQKLMQRMIVWSRKSDALCMEQFYDEESICCETLNRWEKKYPEARVLEIKNRVLHTLGSRRDIGALKNELNGAQVRYTAPRYIKDAKQIEEWRSTLTKNDEKLSGSFPIVVEIPIEPDSGLVPDKK